MSCQRYPDEGREGDDQKIGVQVKPDEAVEFGHKGVAVTDCHQHQERVEGHLGSEQAETGLDFIRERLLGIQVLLC